jgi:predicted nucleic acid-binding protein
MSSAILVFDTSPLVHFARESWLGVLKAVVGNRTALVPDIVVAELRLATVQDGRIRSALDAEWLQPRALVSEEEVRAFATFSARLVKGERNRGEAAVLALARVTQGVAVIDDAAGRKAAEDHEIALRPTLALLCDAIRSGLLTVPLVAAVADDLLAGDYRLPFGQGSFERWAKEHGQLG